MEFENVGRGVDVAVDASEPSTDGQVAPPGAARSPRGRRRRWHVGRWLAALIVVAVGAGAAY